MNIGGREPNRGTSMHVSDILGLAGPVRGHGRKPAVVEKGLSVLVHQAPQAGNPKSVWWPTKGELVPMDKLYQPLPCLTLIILSYQFNRCACGTSVLTTFCCYLVL